MRRPALLTNDFALYHDLVQYLRGRGIAFDSLAFGEKPGPHVGVIITSWRDVVRPGIPEGLPVVAVSLDEAGKEDVAAAVAQALRILEGVKGYREVVFGVDPGKRPGVAVLGDGRLVHTAQVFSPQEVAPLLHGLVNQFPADRYLVRVGHGAPRERDLILEALPKAVSQQNVVIELVDETGTTPATGRQKRFPSDVAAALEIARTPGRVAPRPRRHVSKGQIREVQRESRELTGGKLSVSRDVARRVARGDVSLGEAIGSDSSDHAPSTSTPPGKKKK